MYSQGEMANYESSGYYMYHQFNTQQFYVFPTQRIYVFCVDLKTNSDYFPILHWLTGSYQWDGDYLLRGTDWIFMCNSLYSLCLKG